MALVASSIAGAGYALTSAEDKDSGNGFEFTRRRRWPHLLLQELIGSTLFCLKPVPRQGHGGRHDSGSRAAGMSWKMVYVSPSVGDMVGQKASDLEGNDFFDFVYGPDQAQLQSLFTSLLHPPPPFPQHSSSNSNSASTTSSGSGVQHNSPNPLGISHTTYVRILSSDSSLLRPGSIGGSAGKTRGRGNAGPSVWEIRAHATGLSGGEEGLLTRGGFGPGWAGSMIPSTGPEEAGLRGKAVWVMGRKVGESGTEVENQQSLDAFLELKLENERLMEELRELQLDLNDPDEFAVCDPTLRAPTYNSNLSSPSTSDSSSGEESADSSHYANVIFPSTVRGEIEKKPGRPPKDKDREGREKKRLKKSSIGLTGNGRGREGEGMHVCVTCGRTDSPEWRKGPLGPKTLCNACGLRWAKRNSNLPTRKERKAAAESKK